MNELRYEFGRFRKEIRIVSQIGLHEPFRNFTNSQITAKVTMSSEPIVSLANFVTL